MEGKLLTRKVIMNRMGSEATASSIQSFVNSTSDHLAEMLFPRVQNEKLRRKYLGADAFKRQLTNLYNRKLEQAGAKELRIIENEKRKLSRARLGKAHQQRGLKSRKDFYAVLIQGTRNKREHLYVITDSLTDQVESISDDGLQLRGTCSWQVERDIQPGIYSLEFGSRIAGICTITRPFRITETFCMEADDSTIGVWCICEDANPCISRGQWVACSVCNSWHHWSCYEKTRIRKGKQRRDLEEQLGSVKNPKTKAAKRMRQSLEERIASDVSSHPGGIELLLLGHEKQQKFPSKKESFYCWMCFDYSSIHDNVVNRELRVPSTVLQLNLRVPAMIRECFMRRTNRLIHMIQKASGGYKRLKVNDLKDNGEENKLLYCTPHNVVCFLRTLIGTKFSRSNSFIDIGAGTGNLSSVLPDGSRAVEKEPDRYEKGKKRLPRLRWLNTVGYACARNVI